MKVAAEFRCKLASDKVYQKLLDLIKLAIRSGSRNLAWPAREAPEYYHMANVVDLPNEELSNIDKSYKDAAKNNLSNFSSDEIRKLAQMLADLPERYEQLPLYMLEQLTQWAKEERIDTPWREDNINLLTSVPNKKLRELSGEQLLEIHNEICDLLISRYQKDDLLVRFLREIENVAKYLYMSREGQANW